jgi:hypothetical protein
MRTCIVSARKTEPTCLSTCLGAWHPTRGRRIPPQPSLGLLLLAEGALAHVSVVVPDHAVHQHAGRVGDDKVLERVRPVRHHRRTVA